MAHAILPSPSKIQTHTTHTLTAIESKTLKCIENMNSKDSKEEASWHAKYKGSAYVFVGGIPFDLTEVDLLAIFAQNKDTEKSKGFAFPAYENQRSTILAVDNLNGAKILDRVIRADHVANYKKKGEKDEATKT